MCTLPGRSKSTDSDSDGDYELSTASSRDLQLDSDMECTVQGSDEEGHESENVLQLLQYHRDAFYKAFTPYYEVASKSSKLITDEKYAMIRDIIRTQKGKKEKPIIVKYRRLYSIVGNVEDRCLYRKNKVVTTFEKVFDVILEAHSRISHARNPKSNLSCITDTLGYYGVPIEAVKHFINTCPLVCITLWFMILCFLIDEVDPSFYYQRSLYVSILKCVPNKSMPKRSKQQPLKMILSKAAGSRFQMDLVQMPEYNSFNYILRVVDHLSKFGYVQPLKKRSAKEVGDALIGILCSSIMPKILQSDNGAEVSVLCIQITISLPLLIL